MLLGIVLMAFMPPGTAFAGQGNSGDVWTDNVGQPPGPGHEQDPHLSCSDINIWANGMSGSGGTYKVFSWPPSGSQEQVYSNTWSYNQNQGGDQVISVIPVNKLISNTAANGDAPKNSQGYHFKLQVLQDPAKYKTFWVNCSPPSPPPPPPCGSQGGQQCPPPPCSQTGTCPPGPPGPPTVVVVTSPPQVVVVPCSCQCKPGKHHHPAKPKCPPVNKAKFRLSFKPTQPISHGVVTFFASAPKSAHAGKIVLTIRGHENGHSRTLVFHRSSVTKPINVGNPFYWGVTYLHGVDVGTWGHYTVTAEFFLKCGKKVVVTTAILNNDPPKGVAVPK